MKRLILMLPFLALGSVVYADVEAIVSVQKESGLEADHDTMQIKDIDAERKMAKEQAAVQSSIAKEAKERLEKVKSQKELTEEKARAEITNYENQRKEAEKTNKKYREESERLTSDIKKLEESNDKSRRAAKDAIQISEAGKEELRMIRERKARLEEENKKAIYAQTQAEGEMLRLREEYARVNDSIKDLEKRIALNQDAAKKKQAMIAIGAHKVGELQTKEAQMKTALGMKATIAAKPPVVADPQTVLAKNAKPVALARPALAQPKNDEQRQPNSVDSIAPATDTVTTAPANVAPGDTASSVP